MSEQLNPPEDATAALINTLVAVGIVHSGDPRHVDRFLALEVADNLTPLESQALYHFAVLVTKLVMPK